MASGSSSTCSVVRRRGPFVPTIPCPDCHKLVTRNVSRTEKHNGCAYYKCKSHRDGCNFWHWELEYVVYLVDNDILVGDYAVEAIGWSKERREERSFGRQRTKPLAMELHIAYENKKKEEEEAEEEKLKEQQLLTNIEVVLDSLKMVRILLVMIVALLCLMCGMLLVKKSKSM